MINRILTNKITNLDYKTYFNQAIEYTQYLSNFQHEMEHEPERIYSQYLPQNWQRQSRLDRKFKLNEAVLHTLKSVQRPLKWLVITEHWCGDASQINPVINKIAIESEGKIELRFIYRDQNSDLMDAFLTDGRSRSIPMLIQLDKDFNYLAQYGPRPAEAQKLVKASLAKQAPYDLPLHTWYAKDKQNSLQNDLLQIIK